MSLDLPVVPPWTVAQKQAHPAAVHHAPVLPWALDAARSAQLGALVPRQASRRALRRVPRAYLEESLSGSIDLSVFDGTLSQISEVQGELDLWANDIPGFNKSAVQGAIIDGISTGELSGETIGSLVEMVAAVGAGAACAATGLAPLAPFCATAGAFVGNLIGDLFSNRGEKLIVSPEVQQYESARAADLFRIRNQRETLKSQVVNKLRFDPQARAEAAALIDEFYPEWMLSSDPNVNPSAGMMSFDTNTNAERMHQYDVKMVKSIMAPGYFAPFVPFCILGDNFSPGCFDDQAGTYYPPGSWTSYLVPTDPSWMTKFLQVLGGTFDLHGLDMWPTISWLISEADNAGRYATNNIFVQFTLVHNDIKNYLFPLIDEELKKRLEAIYMAAAARVAQKVADAVEALVSEIAAQVGCLTDKCKAPFYPFAKELVVQFDDIGSAQARTLIEKVILDARAYYAKIRDKYTGSHINIGPNMIPAGGFVFKPGNIVLSPDAQLPPDYKPGGENPLDDTGVGTGGAGEAEQGSSASSRTWLFAVAAVGLVLGGVFLQKYFIKGMPDEQSA